MDWKFLPDMIEVHSLRPGDTVGYADPQKYGLCDQPTEYGQIIEIDSTKRIAKIDIDGRVVNIASIDEWYSLFLCVITTGRLQELGFSYYTTDQKWRKNSCHGLWELEYTDKKWTITLYPCNSSEPTRVDYGLTCHHQVVHDLDDPSQMPYNKVDKPIN